jgi:hypothetical protein
MNLKTTLFAGAAGLVLSAALAGTPAAFAGTYPELVKNFGGQRNLPHVHAIGAALNQYAARMEAVHNWRDKVAERYGYELSRWSSARDKNVSCERVSDDDPSWDDYGKRGAKEFQRKLQYNPVTRCHVSAIPARGWGFGWNLR